MRRDIAERAAQESRTAAGRRPRESIGWSWQYHRVVRHNPDPSLMSNIVGLGIDATDIDRIAATIDRFGARFLDRIFTSGEIAYCSRRRVPAIHLAGRFAAKEAAMKALGTGHSRGVLWRDIEVVRRGGPPQLQFHGGAERRFAAIGGRSSLLTITHSQKLALAQVLILRD
jgi:holo-[acyl-carrier protein] synthase